MGFGGLPFGGIGGVPFGGLGGGWGGRMGRMGANINNNNVNNGFPFGRSTNINNNNFGFGRRSVTDEIVAVKEVVNKTETVVSRGTNDTVVKVRRQLNNFGRPRPVTFNAANINNNNVGGDQATANINNNNMGSNGFNINNNNVVNGGSGANINNNNIGKIKFIKLFIYENNFFPSFF
jgi:hypothetical protein